MDPVQTVSVVGEVAVAAGGFDKWELLVSILASVGSLSAAGLALWANHRANQVTRRHQRWERSLYDPVPQPISTEVRSVKRRSTRARPSGERCTLDDGYQVELRLFNPGETPVFVHNWQVNLHHVQGGATSSEPDDQDPPAPISPKRTASFTICVERSRDARGIVDAIHVVVRSSSTTGRVTRRYLISLEHRPCPSGVNQLSVAGTIKDDTPPGLRDGPP